MADERELNPGEINGEDAPIAELAKASLVARRKDDEPVEAPGDDEGQLAIDVYQTGDSIIVESPIAGVAPDDIDIAITSESVTIRGKRVRERHVREEDYVYQECYWGKFSRSVSLPQEVDADKAEASIKNGVLTIVIPKLNRSKAKKLKVKTD
ncbi:MAG: Hsp20/alpha crystallin family protein [Patescibacteria group bacterium]